MKKLQAGTIIKTVGLNGELKVKSSTFFAEERYQPGNTVYLSKDNKNFKKYTVESYRFYQGFDFIYLEEVLSIEEAKKLIGFNILVDKDELELDEDVYFFCDLKGCKVFNNLTKEEIGIVKEVEEFPAQITLAVKVKASGKISYIPFVKAFVEEVNISKKEIYINVIEGLIE